MALTSVQFGWNSEKLHRIVNKSTFDGNLFEQRHISNTAVAK